MPLQIVEAKEAGAAGVLGTIANVSGPRGAPVLSSYAAAIGLDCPVEVSLGLHCKQLCMPAAERCDWGIRKAAALQVCRDRLRKICVCGIKHQGMVASSPAPCMLSCMSGSSVESSIMRACRW